MNEFKTNLIASLLFILVTLLSGFAGYTIALSQKTVPIEIIKEVKVPETERILACIKTNTCGKKVEKKQVIKEEIPVKFDTSTLYMPLLFLCIMMLAGFVIWQHSRINKL